MSKVDSGADIYATIHTNMGDVQLKLFSKDAPKTVKNFVGLASGEREWKHPVTGEVKKGVPFYNGVIFHRVIPGFMIQGGDPLGVGRGGPGYTFEDEFQSGRTFDHVGILAMANSGPATNGSQFFITTSTPQHLNGRHTIFGEVVKGYDIVEAISKAQTVGANKPAQPITINSISLSDNP
jgi:peptidyl-prolyl cis-trans isomerase A (cyclophilin A)